MSSELERARWEGGIETRVGDAERRLDAINGSISTHAQATNNLAITVGQLVTKVSMYAAIGSVAGGAVAAAVVKFLFG